MFLFIYRLEDEDSCNFVAIKTAPKVKSMLTFFKRALFFMLRSVVRNCFLFVYAETSVDRTSKGRSDIPA
jgi:hypothetical protein